MSDQISNIQPCVELIRSSVDSLYLAVKATLPRQLLDQLQTAKQLAASQRREAPIKLWNSEIQAMVPAGGQAGGFSFVFDTGPLGARFACRETSDQLDWNLFIKPHATAFLTLGFWPAYGHISNVIKAVGGQVAEISVNRVDYAIDFRADEFALDLDQFIAHPKSKRVPNWSFTDNYHPRAVLTGRRLESVTIGKMPGRQVIVYDKTAEARSKQHLYWYDAWRIDPSDKIAKVWRLELRLGRDALRHPPQIRNFDQLKEFLRPSLLELLQQIRYVAVGEVDPNVSRRKSHPLWQSAADHIKVADLLDGTGDLLPDRFLEITEAAKIETHKKLIIGNAAALAATLNYDGQKIETHLPNFVAEAISNAIPTQSFQDSVTRARKANEIKFGGDHKS